MNPHPKLYIGNRNYSSWSLRPWLFLHEFGVHFDTEVIPLDTPEFRDQIARVSPSLRVPVLVDGDVHVWDSLAICLYAIDHWIGSAAMPLDPAARAMCQSIVAEMHSGFSGLRTQCPMNIRQRRARFALSAEAAADVGRIQTLWRDARSAFGGEGPFLFGAFSLADAFYAPVVTRFLSYAVALDEVSRQYCDAVMQTAGMRAWCAAAESEPWALAATDNVTG
jgi:glutathione S-transferase